MTNTDDESPVRTGGGDDGRSSLIDGARRYKDDVAFDALGTLDEAQVALGVCRSLVTPSNAPRGMRRRAAQKSTTALPNRSAKRLSTDLRWIQERLLIAGGVLASTPSHPPGEGLDTIGEGDLDRLAKIFDHWRGAVHIPPRFFIAGDTRIGAEFDRARTVVRRSERAVVRLVRERGLPEQALVARFLNHLSDLVFVLARWADSKGRDLHEEA